MKALRYSGLSLLVALLLVAAACGGTAGPQAPEVEWTLNVEGEAGNPLALSYADLAAMEQASLDQVLMQKSRGEDTVNDWEGVPLSAILEQAEAVSAASGITAMAADGYAIMIPTADLEDAIVALRMDGDWIATADPGQGPIRLVVPNKPSNHWIFQLSTIVVEGPGALPPQVDWELSFEGAMDNERTFEYVQLSGQDLVLLEGVLMQTKSGESTHDFEGVPLTTLFDLTAVHSDAEAITATAADGYSATIAVSDLGKDAMVALRMDGEWLATTDPESPIQLVVPGLPASQWVSQLVSITVE